MQKNDYVVKGISTGMHTMVWKCQINYQKDFKLIVLALLHSQFPTCPQKLCLQYTMLATFLVTFKNSNLAVVQFKGSFWVQFR